MMKGLKEWLKGKKTYIVAISAITTAVLSYVNDQISTIQLIEAIYVAVGAITLRAAIAKS